MKLLLATIVLANLLAFYWFGGQSRSLEGNQGLQRLDTDIPGLVLIAELAQGDIRLTGDNLSERNSSDFDKANSQETIAVHTIAFESTGSETGLESIDRERCWVLGPVVDESVIQRLSREVAIFELGVTTRQVEAGEAGGFLVYMPSLYSDQVLRVRRQDLEAKGVANFLVHDGKFKNAISLGFFTSEANARDWQNQLRIMGFDSKVAASGSITLSFWVTLSAQVYESLASEFWADISRLNPDLEVSVIACDSE